MKTIIALAVLAFATAAHADTFLTVSDYSYHLNRERAEKKDLNERNLGVGIEQTVSETVSAVGGYYKNSFYRPSFYAGAQWLPLSLGPVRIGAQGGAVTGYSNSAARPYAAAVAEVMIGKFGANFIAIPPAAKVGSGVLTVQLKYKF